MNCPECGAWSTVMSTRESPTFGHMRRRECANHHMFSTQELVVPKEALAEERASNLAKAQKAAAVVNAKRRRKI